MRKFKINVSVIIGLLLSFNFIFTAFAAETVDYDSTPEIVVQKYFDSMGNDWNEFADQYTAEQVNSFKKFLSDDINISTSTGVLNVQGADLTECVEVAYNDVKEMFSVNYNNKDVKTFVVGADYIVNADSIYFSSGINYNLISLVKEGNEWKVVELVPISDPELLKDKGYEFSDQYSIAEAMMDARYEGYLLNGNLEIFADTNNNPVSESIIVPYTVINTRTVPTSTTTIVYGTYSGSTYQSKQTINFHDYCIGVTAGECRATSFDGAARNAIALAIKTYTWHYKIVPIDPAHGVDIKNTMQSYQPTKVSENSKVTTDYNTVKDIWMESYKGAIFEAGYGAGSYDGTGQNGGRLMQNGCRYLVENKSKTFYGCLHYYYDSSTASEDGAIRFFDKDKNDLNK